MIINENMNFVDIFEVLSTVQDSILASDKRVSFVTKLIFGLIEFGFELFNTIDNNHVKFVNVL